jgi:hypothetical protein
LEQRKIPYPCRYSNPGSFMAKAMNMNDKTKNYMKIELLFCLKNIRLTEHLHYKIRKFILFFFNTHQRYNCW